MKDEKLPALRAVDVTPLRREDNQLFFALQDLSRIAPRPMVVSAAAYFVLTQFDGQHSCTEIQEAFRRQFGRSITAEAIDRLVAALDDGLFLDTERFDQAYTDRSKAYLAAAARDNRDRWPGADVVRDEIEQMLNRGVAAPGRDLGGVIAPHLDYRRGCPCYADAYATLAKSPPADRYVVLGTNHFGRSTGVVATRKDFQTPLGLVQTEREFIRRLEERVGQGLCEGEFDHFAEHSVELQVHILQVCLAERRFEIVPVLCPDPFGKVGMGAADSRRPDLGRFADAIAELVAQDDRRTVLIAAADLSHVGQRFGDPEPTAPEALEEVGRFDRRLLALLEARQDDGFLAAISASDNRTRVCSAGCIYALLRALPGRACRVLTYHQAVNLEMEISVTCAAAVLG